MYTRARPRVHRQLYSSFAFQRVRFPPSHRQPCSRRLCSACLTALLWVLLVKLFAPPRDWATMPRVRQPAVVILPAVLTSTAFRRLAPDIRVTTVAPIRFRGPLVRQSNLSASTALTRPAGFVLRVVAVESDTGTATEKTSWDSTSGARSRIAIRHRWAHTRCTA